jgi:hypothetical protein
MDREMNYRGIIKRGLAAHRDLSNGARRDVKDDIEAMCVFDDDAGQYLLVRVGWQGKRRFRQIVVHVRLHDGKIWIETDDTYDGFATELVKAGVPNGDIVLAFHPPQLRFMTDFAVA